MRIGKTEIDLAEPVRSPVKWIGQRELVEQVLACWTVLTSGDLPLCPRLVGKPGMGKTTLAQAAAQELERPVFIHQCTMDTRPEDLLVTPVLDANGAIRYQASPLVSAMVTGGVAILDEANRMSEKSWASLAPLLDYRRYADSVIAGVRIEAGRDFRCCITMNDDASTYEIPDYILSRIQPMVALGFPDSREELEILRYNVDFAPEDLVRMTADFLQEGHRFRLDYSTRDGINIMRYALKLGERNGMPLEESFHRAVEQTLGEGAEEFEKRAKDPLIQDNWADFHSFFGPRGREEGGKGREERK